MKIIVPASAVGVDINSTPTARIYHLIVLLMRYGGKADALIVAIKQKASVLVWNPIA